jgi:hypothetical protein
MKGTMLVLSFVLVVGTGLAVRVGLTMRRTKLRAQKASAEIKVATENARARRELRKNWSNEHEVISDVRFVGYPHQSQTIGGTTVSCPKCKEL